MMMNGESEPPPATPDTWGYSLKLREIGMILLKVIGGGIAIGFIIYWLIH